MKGPNLAKLRQRIPNKYMLVAAASKRARQLMGGSAPRLDNVRGKPVSIALQEIASGVIVPEIPENDRE